MRMKIMIVEDDRKIAGELAVLLSGNGYECKISYGGGQVFDEIDGFHPDLVLLDLNLPETDGLYVCRRLRAESALPVVVVTSRSTDVDELQSMHFGADDFIAKPFRPHILLARIASVLRRTYRTDAADRLTGDGFVIHLSKSMLESGGVCTELTKNELRILCCLYASRGSIVSREKLMQDLWDSELFVDDNTLTVNMARLRRKLSEARLDDLIETRRGQGYLMR